MSWTNVWTHHFYELGKSKPHLDGEAIRVVAHGPDEPIVVAQQVVVQSLRLRVGHCSTDHRQKERHKHAPHLRPSPPLKGNGRKISLERWTLRGKEDLGFALRRRISWEREDTADTTETGHRMEDHSFIPSSRRDYFLRHLIHTKLWIPLHFYLIHIDGVLAEGEAAWPWNSKSLRLVG